MSSYNLGRAQQQKTRNVAHSSPAIGLRRGVPTPAVLSTVQESKSFAVTLVRPSGHHRQFTEESTIPVDIVFSEILLSAYSRTSSTDDSPFSVQNTMPTISCQKELCNGSC